ncbi:MAG: Hsp20/alpha crystallin family protein [Candidatus Pacebacteria bacterium]|nr:Hsp20/alpha crystallin family protein [Candidatus Paceibacterota bacterium]
MRKPSFFEKLTGSISPDDYDDLFEGGPNEQTPAQPSALHVDESEVPEQQSVNEHPAQWEQENEEEVQEGELSVDIYQTADSIVVKALVAGVNPNTIDISLTRDMVTIRGSREEHKEVEQENYFYKELYWGSFARTILLPEEVDVDEADASTNHGILVIRLPKINKDRKTKLKVKSR